MTNPLQPVRLQGIEEVFRDYAECGSVVGIGGTVSGLAANVTLGRLVVGIGGTVSGLAAVVTRGRFVGCGSVVGIGGTVSGLAAIAGLGRFVVGIGGTVSGLAAIITCGRVVGIGGTVSGLATAKLATAVNATAKIRLRSIFERAVICLCSLATERTMQVKSNPKVSWGLQQK